LPSPESSEDTREATTANDGETEAFGGFLDGESWSRVKEPPTDALSLGVVAGIVGATDGDSAGVYGTTEAVVCVPTTDGAPSGLRDGALFGVRDGVSFSVREGLSFALRDGV
jgi:hypothetical protein